MSNPCSMIAVCSPSGILSKCRTGPAKAATAEPVAGSSSIPKSGANIRPRKEWPNPSVSRVYRKAPCVLNARCQAERTGLAQYLVPEGSALDKAGELAAKAAEMAPLTVLGVLQALPRIQDMGEDDGLFVESMMAALAQTGPEAAARLADFAEKRGAKVSNPSEG